MRKMAVYLVVAADLGDQVAKIARKAKIKQAEVYHLAIRCGLKEAEHRLMADANRLFPNIDALPRSILDAWYRSKESREWDQIEETATQAQSISKIANRRT